MWAVRGSGAVGGQGMERAGVSVGGDGAARDEGQSGELEQGAAGCGKGWGFGERGWGGQGRPPVQGFIRCACKVNWPFRVDSVCENDGVVWSLAYPPSLVRDFSLFLALLSAAPRIWLTSSGKMQPWWDHESWLPGNSPPIPAVSGNGGDRRYPGECPQTTEAVRKLRRSSCA